MPRFVILLHEPGPASSQPEHFDFMLEPQEHTGLATWRWDKIPTQSTSFRAIQLPPHRLGYLDYEGTISRDRGRVTRRVIGVYTNIISLDDNQWQIRLESEQLKGLLDAKCLEGTNWQFQFKLD